MGFVPVKIRKKENVISFLIWWGKSLIYLPFLKKKLKKPPNMK